MKTSLCSRTKSLQLAEEDLAELGNGKKPTEKVSDAAIENNTNILLVLLMAVTLGLLIWIYSRQRKKK
ncbi:hypothetical protein [Bacillus massiliigorillae]|uniref:hypothetical protein n=1 Tax=Bacillus massiliigorillae TaxID=1243664 RepID=UPI0003A9C40D|nr:hypothetical protein [Bacillus massiliigorillae]